MRIVAICSIGMLFIVGCGDRGFRNTSPNIATAQLDTKSQVALTNQSLKAAMDQVLTLEHICQALDPAVGPKVQILTLIGEIAANLKTTASDLDKTAISAVADEKRDKDKQAHIDDLEASNPLRKFLYVIAGICLSLSVVLPLLGMFFGGAATAVLGLRKMLLASGLLFAAGCAYGAIAYWIVTLFWIAITGIGTLAALAIAAVIVLSIKWLNTHKDLTKVITGVQVVKAAGVPLGSEAANQMMNAVQGPPTSRLRKLVNEIQGKKAA